MIKNPKISVIVPVYNAEAYLSRCIDSILNQTFSDFELLLINDGSKDSSSIICNNYAKKDNRIKVYHKENGGVSTARNHGLKEASGEWICFCDSDDWVDKQWLEGFDTEQNVSLIIQGYKYTMFNNNKQQYVNYNKQTYVRDQFKDLFQLLIDTNNVGYLWNKAFKKNLIRENRIFFNEQFHIKEDEEFIMHYFLYSTNVLVSPFSEYNYFMPDFFEKYKNYDIIEKIDCNISIIDNLYIILKTYKHDYFKILFSSCIEQIIYTLKYKDIQESNLILKVYRKLYKKRMKKIFLENIFSLKISFFYYTTYYNFRILHYGNWIVLHFFKNLQNLLIKTKIK